MCDKLIEPLVRTGPRFGVIKIRSDAMNENSSSPAVALRPHVARRATRAGVLERIQRLFTVACCALAFTAVAAQDNPYSGYTDAQLAELAQTWADLDADQRRNYLVEMRRRMADSGKRQVPVDAEARFGRVSNGVEAPGPSGVVSEEGVVRQVIEPGRVTTESLVVRRNESGFGVGFERRVEIRGKPADREERDARRGPPPRDGRKPPPPRDSDRPPPRSDRPPRR